MTEKCGGDVVFTVPASVRKIGGVFPEATVLFTQGALLEVDCDGVYIVDIGKIRIVGIKGKCPNVAYCERLVGVPCPIEGLKQK